MSKATFVSLKWLAIACSNVPVLSKFIVDLINVIKYLHAKCCNTFKYVHAECARYGQVKISGLKLEKFVQHNGFRGGKCQ